MKFVKQCMYMYFLLQISLLHLDSDSTCLTIEEAMQYLCLVVYGCSLKQVATSPLPFVLVGLLNFQARQNHSYQMSLEIISVDLHEFTVLKKSEYPHDSFWNFAHGNQDADFLYIGPIN